ncbi:hypothetical protein FRC01_010016 [Tulasnella sp. 417]|nr:hypothetical protein FRC01_010016 [Tulasnella sp. 417]
MVSATRGKTSKKKAAPYDEHDSDEDAPMNDTVRTFRLSDWFVHKAFVLQPEPKIIQRDPRRESCAEDFGSCPHHLRMRTLIPFGEFEPDDVHEMSDSKTRQSHSFPAPTGKVKGKGKAKTRLYTLFDRLPIDIIYMVPATHF